MISAIVLAAGQSKRMGQPKMLLPWGNVTVIEYVISVFAKAGVEDILVVTGGAREQVEAIAESCKGQYPVRSVYNDRYASVEMLSSIQCGLQSLVDECIGAAMIGLGDQPQVEERSVRSVMEAYARTGNPIIAPSYKMRRGHPWLIARSIWSEMLGMSPSQTPRDFLNEHADQIQYVNVDTPSVLSDLDTPEDYRTTRP